MTTCRDIVIRSLQQANVLALGDEPTAEEADAGLEALQGMFQAWFASGEFGCLNDVYHESAHTALEQERVTTPDGVVVTLPQTYSANSTEYGGGSGSRRAPYDLAAIQVVQNGEVKSYIWDRRHWVEIEALTLDDDAPLAYFGVAGMSACLAMEWVELFGEQIGPGQKRAADAFKAAFRARRVAANPATVVEYA